MYVEKIHTSMVSLGISELSTVGPNDGNALGSIDGNLVGYLVVRNDECLECLRVIHLAASRASDSMSLRVTR